MSQSHQVVLCSHLTRRRASDSQEPGTPEVHYTREETDGSGPREDRRTGLPPAYSARAASGPPADAPAAVIEQRPMCPDFIPFQRVEGNGPGGERPEADDNTASVKGSDLPQPRKNSRKEDCKQHEDYPHEPIGRWIIPERPPQDDLDHERCPSRPAAEQHRRPEPWRLNRLDLVESGSHVHVYALCRPGEPAPT